MATLLPADDPDALGRAVALLDAGELVVIPTGAEYALACDALHEDAIDRLFLLKNRGADMGVPILVAGVEEAHHAAFPTPLARDLGEAFWPGSVALVLRARPWVPDALTGHAGTVALRCPPSSFARDLARHFGPLAATRLDALTAKDAAQLAGAAAALALDGGAGRAEALTVVDATGDAANVLREGHVRAAEVLAHGRVRH